MNFIGNSYSRELLFRFWYLCLSFLFCFFVCYWKSDVYLTFITYPYLKLNTFKRLIAINVNELFFLSIYISTNISLIFNFPFLVSQIKSLFCSAWFRNQVQDYGIINRWIWSLFVSFLLVCYAIILPSIGKFLVELDLETHGGLLILELEPRMTNYLDWVFPLLFSTANFLPCIMLMLFWLLQNNSQKLLIFTLVNYRKFVTILLFCLIIIVVPIDLNWQIILFCLLWSAFELFLFCCCWYE